MRFLFDRFWLACSPNLGISSLNEEINFLPKLPEPWSGFQRLLIDIAYFPSVVTPCKRHSNLASVTPLSTTPWPGFQRLLIDIVYFPSVVTLCKRHTNLA